MLLQEKEDETICVDYNRHFEHDDQVVSWHLC